MADSTKTKDSRLRVRLCFAGALVAGIGLLVIIGWVAGHPAFVQFIPTGPPMVFNTAVSLVVTGGAMVALANGMLNFSKALGACILIVGLSTLSEYLTGSDLGIDELLWKQQMLMQVSGLGRMGPNTAFTFCVIGLNILLMASKRLWSRTVVVLSSIILAVSFIGICGYLTGLGAAFRWGRFTGTALPTYCGFFVTGLAALTWVRAQPVTFATAAFSIPFFATASVMTLLVGAVSFASNRTQEDSARWVSHTEVVIATLHAVELKLSQLESAMRGLLLTKQAIYMASYNEDEKAALNELTRLQVLVSDNLLETGRTQALKEKVRRMLTWTRATVDAAERGDFFRSAEALDKGTDRLLMDVIRAQTAELEATERHLLSEREQASSRNAAQARGVILLGSGLATAFFAIALVIAQRAAAARVKTQAALNESQRRLDLALESAEMGAWDLDMVDDSSARSLRHDQIFGYETLQPRWSVEIFMSHVLKEDRPQVEECFARAIATNHFGAQCRIVWPDQSVHWISAQGRVFRNPEGKPIRMLGVISDITPVKTLQRELQERNQALQIESSRAQEANRLKSEFLANMSHELRTPLNAIIGFSELLIDGNAGPLNEGQLDFLSDVLGSAEHLLHLINDLLDLAKIEAGRMELFLEEFDLDMVIQDVAGVLQPLARRKGITLESAITGTPFLVTLDQKRVKQILLNLLSNAIKFTGENGAIQVGVNPVGEQQFEISVTDNGIGIKAEDFPRLFIQFEQLATGTARPSQGTGLGLALTRKMVQLHRGSISVTSEPGKGARFAVILPREAGAEKV